MAKFDACPVCGYEFKRSGGLAATRGKCPNCGLLIQILGPGERPPLDEPESSQPPAAGPPSEPADAPVRRTVDEPLPPRPGAEPLPPIAPMAVSGRPGELDHAGRFDELLDEPPPAPFSEAPEMPAVPPEEPHDEESDEQEEFYGGEEAPLAGAGTPLAEMPKWVWAVAGVLAVIAVVAVGFYIASGRSGTSEPVARSEPGRLPAPAEPGPVSEPAGPSQGPLEPSGGPAAPSDVGVGPGIEDPFAVGPQLPGPTEPPAPDETFPAVEPPDEPRAQEPSGPSGEGGVAAEPPPVEPPAQAPQARIAKSLEEAVEAIVKFEVPVAGQARMQYGCGFLIDGRGWIATTHHVIAGATTAARVTFADGTERGLAGIVAASPERDLAIVKLEDPPETLTILDIGYDQRPELASQVFALGHPYNADFSLSQGIVGRVLTTADLRAGPQPNVVTAMRAPADMIWIQADAKISPGNSGGPLLNGQGRVIGVNTFVNVRAEFGYASHVRYLRELAAGASDAVTPLPAAQPLAETIGEGHGQLKPGQVVVSVGRMQQLFDACQAFSWMPHRAEQYETLAELAKLMTLAKHLQAIPKAVQASPEAVRNLTALADQLFADMQRAGWRAQHAEAINAFAADRLDRPGEGAMLFTSVVAGTDNALLLEVRGTDKQIVIPVGSILSKSPRGTNWLVIGFISPQTAQVKGADQSPPQRVPVVLTHYMLKVR